MSNKIIQNTGFGLLEVLIAIVIVSIGLLGLAALQSKSLQSLQEGDNIATAAVIANDVVQRMLANPYITAQGRQGYLELDTSGDIGTAGGVTPWAAGVLAGSPEILRCYSADATESCYASGATVGNSADHIDALNNLALLDQVETRELAWNLLPDGEIKICFDSTNALDSWTCDGVAVRNTDRKENVYTVKIRWNNLFTDSSQVYSVQFTAYCTDDDAAFCGN